VFRAKRADLIKVLFWDGTGLCVLGMPTGKWTPFPRRSAYLSEWYYAYFLNARLAAAARRRSAQVRDTLNRSPSSPVPRAGSFGDTPEGDVRH
jgi:hypothetical protein